MAYFYVVTMVLNLFPPISQLLYSLQTSHTLITNVNIMCNIQRWTHQYQIQVIDCGCCLMHHPHDVGFFLHWDSLVRLIFRSSWKSALLFGKDDVATSISNRCSPREMKIQQVEAMELVSILSSAMIFWILHLHTLQWPVYILHF